MPMRSVTRTLNPVPGWDFDMALVRDPRYPVANPRIAMSGRYMVRATFVKSRLVMLAEQIYNADSILVDGRSVEADSPMVLLPTPELFAISKDGVVASSPGTLGRVSTPSGQPDVAWVHLENLPVDKSDPIPRRLRALSVIPRTAGDVHLFYISTKHELVFRRRDGANPWTKATAVDVGGPLHPFTSLTGTSRSSLSIHTFFLDHAGCLTTATWPSATNPPRGFAHNSIETQPSLLNGTSLAAVSPSTHHILVFGIDKTQHLRMAVYTDSPIASWIPPTPLSTASDDRVFAHAHIAAHAINASTVRVATISDTNVPCVYTVRLQGTSWVMLSNEPRALFPQKRQPVPKTWRDPATTSLVTRAFEFDVNPFGDVCFDVDERGELVLAAVGVKPGEGAVLVRKVNVAAGKWMRVRAGGGSLLR
jgi:hypothetical protein